jgi:SAM-dependent methyltransferase
MWECGNLKKSLLAFLRCPDCDGKLSLAVSRESDGEIERGSLTCQACRQAFPIIRFVPRFVSSDEYARSFSVQWNIFPTTQLDRESVTTSIGTFVRKTGVRPRDLAGRLVLEAGCGMGRFVDIVSRERSTVIGFDLSMAVEAAHRNVGSRPNVHILQADIMKLPFPDGIFDFIFSIGVLHHTPHPERAFRNLVHLLKKGGEIAVWVYQRYRRPPLSDVYRAITRRMPWSMVLGFSKVLVKLYWLYNNLPHAWLTYFWHVIPISMERDPELRLLDTFDWYSPRYQFRFTTEQVLAWFREMALSEVQTQAVPGVSVRARR